MGLAQYFEKNTHQISEIIKKILTDMNTFRRYINLNLHFSLRLGTVVFPN